MITDKTLAACFAAALFFAPAAARCAGQAGAFALDGVSAADLAARPGTASLPLPAAPEADKALDITGLYQSLFSSGPGLRSRELAELRGLRVLFVPGFMTERLLPAGAKALPAPPKYFEEHLALLRSLGVDCAVAPINSEATVRQNAAVIAALAAASPKPVLLVAHSKGGLDALEALLSYPRARANTRAVVALMAPFFGAPIADKVLASPPLSGAAVRLLELMGGSRQALADLSAAERAVYYGARAGAIAGLLREVPVLSVAARKDDDNWNFDTLLEPFRDYMLALGLPNDGLVPAASAILPGTRYVVLDGLDHLATVINVKRPGYDRARFLETVLTLALGRGTDKYEKN